MRAGDARFSQKTAGLYPTLPCGKAADMVGFFCWDEIPSRSVYP
jgi:hypothetical protein